LYIKQVLSGARSNERSFGLLRNGLGWCKSLGSEYQQQQCLQAVRTGGSGL
jgi:hypothetical protein